MAKKQIVKALEKGASDKRTLSTTKAAARALAAEFKPNQIAAKLGITTQKWTAVKNKITKGKLFNPDLRDLLRKVESKLSGRKIERKETKEEKAARLDLGLSKKEFKEQNKKIKKESGLPEGGIVGDQVAKVKKESGLPEGGIVGDQVAKVKKEKRVQYRGGREGEEGKEGGVYYYKYHEDLLKDAPECKIVFTGGDYAQARVWWGDIGGGNVYFVISREKAKGKKNEGKYKYHVVDIRTNEERARKNRGKLSGAAKAREEIERAQEIYNNYKAGKE